MKIENNISAEELHREKQTSAVKQWDSYFLQTLLKEMRKTIPKSDLFGNSFAMNTFYDMLDKQIADNIAESGSLSMSQNLFKKMFKEQTQELQKKQIGEIYKKNSEI
ncbi:MAG: hypothetical protein A2Y40_07060 [Candidatus Margulisbacteria bacterium GWF2_35_9]|nr:MAG: hypothetical protein A2Y40_07060 [Candidatus Margulisbacteria bacterium GWF2_35_9]